jgi:membrane protease YdiL (CAAX protease family)
MEETVRILVCVGFAFLLLLLRLDAQRFGVAEYLDEAVGTPLAISRRRLAWYLLGLAFSAAILIIHPDADNQLGLHPGDEGPALLAGLGYGAIGVAQAAGLALWRTGGLDVPDPRAFPWGVTDAVLTAFLDEVAFRGVLLGFLLAAGLEAAPAIVVAALVYALATRTGARGRDPYRVVLALAIGLLGGWLTVATGGIGAAFLGHAITRIAVFAFIGRPEPAWIPEDEVHHDAGPEPPPATGPRGSGVRAS